MGLPLQPLNELEAVNVLLEAIGELPVNSLEATGVSEVSIARNTLHRISRQVQEYGLESNTERNYPLIPDVNGYIYLPSNTLKVDASDSNMEVIQRGNRLYDKKNHTYKFKDKVEVDIVFFLPFDELPQVARDYITIVASRVFQANVIGSANTDNLLADDEQKAWIALFNAELSVGDYNVFNSTDTMMMLRR